MEYLVVINWIKKIADLQIMVNRVNYLNLFSSDPNKLQI